LLDLDFYLNPIKNILVDYGASFNDSNQAPRMGELLASRGCPFQCAFCAVPALSQHRMRYHSPERVVADISDLLGRGANFVYFNDDCFTVNRQYTLALCNEIERVFGSRIPWVAQSRAENVDACLLAAMRRSGCVRIEFGFESGSRRMLRLLDKKAELANYYRAAELARAAGLQFQANMIVGCPEETRADIEASQAFLKTVQPDSVLLNVFWPLPGTRIWCRLASGRIALRSPSVQGLRFSVDDPLPMPAHPMLVRHNFTEMSDETFAATVTEMLELAPEAKQYFLDNVSLFEEAVAETGGLMVGRLSRA
jgi:radical SAM superfamily enzyme YgiQ (UPF0313 family)